MGFCRAWKRATLDTSGESLKAEMERSVHTFSLNEAENFHRASLLMSEKETHFVLLDSNRYEGYPYSNFSWMAAIGAEYLLELEANDENLLAQLDLFVKKHAALCFGFLSYDLKNVIEPSLNSHSKDEISSHSLSFFIPSLVVKVDANNIQVEVNNLKVWEKFQRILKSDSNIKKYSDNITLQPRISQKKYLESVKAIRKHIQRGDVYEMNFCTEWFAKAKIDTSAGLFLKLKEKTAAPFSVFGKWNELQLFCASPERYLRREGNKLISQPIKGTQRISENIEENEMFKSWLTLSEKERSENVMITDLVRNDLSRIAIKGSVNVEELSGLYSFKTVHQLISTVVCEVPENTSLGDIIKATFPMGSMTGAPKLSAMEIAEQFEPMSRGIFSGAVGYISPDGNMDFNVVIRSIIYNSALQKVVVRAGSAITMESNPDKEYEECQLKAAALISVLQS
jgi:para-aminobenzoate synthetase component 1